MTAPRTSSLESRPSSRATYYFDYQPSSCEVSPMKARKQNVHCLDAFHERSTTFEYPPNASLYAKRALPPLPPPLSQVPALHKCTSSESLSSRQSSRPGTAMTNRQSCEKSLPPLPSLHKFPSLESVASKPGEVDQTRQTRPRTGRGMSFRGLLHRHSASSTSIDDMPSLTSSRSSRDSRTDSVVGDYALTQISTNTTNAGSLASARRPSFGQLRAAAKKTSAAPPPLPLRSRKASTSAGSRWNPFGRNSDCDKEDIPPMPCTPPVVQELSFTQCYYFFARNCNGYVLTNGPSGDACENCARSGYLGSP